MSVFEFFREVERQMDSGRTWAELVYGEKCENCGERSKDLQLTDDDVSLCPPCMELTIRDTEQFVLDNPEDAKELGIGSSHE